MKVLLILFLVCVASLPRFSPSPPLLPGLPPIRQWTDGAQAYGLLGVKRES